MNCGDRDGETMITNDQELGVTLERIARFQAQVAHLRGAETGPATIMQPLQAF